MKPRDIGFVQQHIEKIVLVLALLFVLAVVWFYIIGKPYSVTLGKQEDVAPGDVWDVLRDKSQVLANKLKDPVSPLPETPIPDYTKEFVARSKRTPLAFSEYPIPLNQPGLQLGPGIQEKIRYELADVPAPTGIRARSGNDVLAASTDPQFAQLMDAWVKVIGNQQPADFRYATVAATFSWKTYQEGLKAAPADRRIPDSWWRPRLGMSSVVLLRQEQDPLTGDWGAVVDGKFAPDKWVEIDPIPTQVVFDMLPGEFVGNEGNLLADQAMSEQEYIQRPAPPPTINAWLPADAEVTQLSPEDQRKLLHLNNTISNLKRKIQSLEARAAAGAERPERPAPRAAAAPPRGMDREMREMMEGPAAPVQRQVPARDQAGELENLRTQLLEKIAERNKLLGIDGPTGEGMDMPMGMEGEMPPGMMFDEFGRPMQMGPRRAMPQPGQAQPWGPEGEMMQPGAGQPGQPGGEMPAEVKVYAHDLSVEPGKTYRYAIQVHVLNPLFQKKNIDPEQEKENLNKLSNASPPSEWSEPVAIEPTIRFYLVSAGTSSAKIEIYRIFNGMWEMRDFTVRPGEMIGEDVQLPVNELPMTVPMKINGMVVDLREVGGATYEMLYIDLDAQGVMKVRNLAQDQSDPDLLRLRAERAKGQVAMQAEGK